MSSAQRIRKHRRALDLTQNDLAALVRPYIPGIDGTDISRIETGRRALKADELPIFAKALRCRLEDLVDPVD